MLGAIMIHFDDESEEIRGAILESLRYAAIHVNVTKVLKAAR
jgi:hypothetical protein